MEIHVHLLLGAVLASILGAVIFGQIKATLPLRFFDGVPCGSPNNTTLGPAHCHIPLCVGATDLDFGLR
jgi:hypothetical protein